MKGVIHICTVHSNCTLFRVFKIVAFASSSLMWSYFYSCRCLKHTVLHNLSGLGVFPFILATVMTPAFRNMYIPISNIEILIVCIMNHSTVGLQLSELRFSIIWTLGVIVLLEYFIKIFCDKCIIIIIIISFTVTSTEGLTATCVCSLE